MQDNFDFGINYSKTVKKENVGGIILDIDALQTDGTTVATIKDLNKTTIDLVYVPARGREEKTIFSGYLGDLLSALYNQDPRYDVYIKPYARGYKVKIGFDNFPVTLLGDDALEIKMNFSVDSYNSLSKVQSSINIETLEAVNRNNNRVLPSIKAYSVTQDSENIDLDLGTDVLGILMMTDHKATFDASTNATVRRVDIFSDDYNKSASENALIIENLEMLAINPDSDMRNMWLYRSDVLLRNVRLKADFKAGTAVGTKVIVTRLQTV